MAWMQSRKGRVVDLVRPRADQVDFEEIARQMADINRYNGACEQPVSIAHHTLIGARAASPAIMPWWLLHDAHETRLGEIITPAVHALEMIAEQECGAGQSLVVHQAIRAFKRRHDEAIHAAAGLAMPTREQIAEIHQIDLIALKTERRDFMARPPQSWTLAIEVTETRLPRIRWAPPADIADALLALFSAWLPALAAETFEAAQ